MIPLSTNESILHETKSYDNLSNVSSKVAMESDQTVHVTKKSNFEKHFKNNNS